MVAMDQGSLRAVGDEDSSKRCQILNGAHKVFMDLGFDGASMGETEIAEYSKELYNFHPERPVVETLTEFGCAYVQMLCRPGGGSASRTVMAIAERMPEVGRRFYNNVIAHTIGKLAAYLETRAAIGDLAIKDCRLAALQFMQLCQGPTFMPFLFQAAPAPSAERTAEIVDSATRMFLAAYGAKVA
jgi:hypothetical protein